MGLPGFKDSGFGFAVGADGGDALGGWYGGAFTFYTGNVDQRAPASSRDNTQWYMLSGYSTWRGKGLFLDTQLTAGYGDLSAHRFIAVGNPRDNTLVARQTNSKRSSALAAVGMTTGANLVYGSTTITPKIAIDGLTMREEGYTETGGGGTTGDGFDLHVNPVVMGSLRGFVGLNARQDVNFGSFFMQPELRFGYRYDFLADRIDLTAQFPGVTGTGPGSGPFTITGPTADEGQCAGRCKRGDNDGRMVHRAQLRHAERQQRKHDAGRHHVAGGADLGRNYRNWFCQRCRRRLPVRSIETVDAMLASCLPNP